MLIRNCAGGVVFKDEEVFILKNDKEEWVFPKGKIRGDELSTETALKRVSYEGGVDAEIVSVAGDTAYEFYSVTREQPVCNKIIWYIMEAKTKAFSINKDEGFIDGGFFPIDKAMEMITYSQDKSLLTLSNKTYEKLKFFHKNLEEATI